MNLIEKSEAQELLSPYVDFLYTWPMQAWDKYHRLIPDELLVEFCARTRASAVHNLIVSQARSAQQSNLRVFNHRKMAGIVINNRLVTRFKKFNEDSSSSSIPTKQVRDFRNQHTLPGFPSTHNLELGYLLNEAQTEIVEVRIAQPSGRGVAWAFAINGGGIQDVVVDIFNNPNQPETREEGALIQPKESAKVATILQFKKGES